ncbi:hypothetical protein Tco_1046183, partial [Tanacetum coccineum]
MSRYVIMVGSTFRIPLLYRGEYSQWRERFKNYLEDQMDGEELFILLLMVNNYCLLLLKCHLLELHQMHLLLLKILNFGLLKRNEFEGLIMRGSEYDEQDRKAAILYEYETFKAIEGEQLLVTYLCYLQVINDLKKCGYKKDNYKLNYKFLNNLQPNWKQCGTQMRQTKNLMDINIDALYNIMKQNQGDVNEAMGYKKKETVATS